MKNLRLLQLFLMLLLPVAVLAQPTEPILRLETGMHSTKGNRLATDAAGKYILTCSEDKTGRLWDAASGQMLKILRVPIGITSEGKLHACALSADGTIAALGGRTGYDWDESISLYIVDTQTGRIIQRLMGLPNVITDLEFSPNGKWLAIALASGGVRILETTNWDEAKQLKGYESDVFGIAFDKNNRFASVCYDGKIRLYDDKFEELRSVTDLPGKQPYSIAFNPAGNLLVVGYEDTPEVEVRSGLDLKLLYQPSVEGVSDHGGLDVLSFSLDGQTLYGGGSHFNAESNKTGGRLIRIWSLAGKGSYRDLPVIKSALMDIKVLPNGNFATLSQYPDLTVLTKEGRVVWSKAAGNNNYGATDESHFRVNTLGTSVGFTPLYETPYIFDLVSKTLLKQASNAPAPVQKNKNTEITNWLNTTSPAVNGHALDFLKDYEEGVSTDVSLSGSSVILGTSWNLYRISPEGKMAWEIPLPAAAWATKITANEKMVVAALGDGTIRWYSMTTGAELLAFYLHADKKRWVLFTPSGYYDASPGAEDLLGWHINNGPNETPSFYPVSRFRDQYNRPDVIDAVLETYDIEKALTLANTRSKKTLTPEKDIKAQLPPVLTILSPANGGTVNKNMVEISYALNTPDDAPVKNVKVLVNGRPVATERGITLLQSSTYTLSVNIPQEDCTVTLLAENEHGLSPEANLYLKYKAPDIAKEEFVKKPKLYILAIGVSDYLNPEYKLKYAAADASGFAAEMKKQKGSLYEDVIVKPLINKDASRENIQDGLQWIQEQTGQRDVAMIFFAGHGMNDNNGIYYMLPAGADVSKLRSTCLNFEEIKQTVSSIAGKVVVFIDACHSGNVMGGAGRRAVTDINALVNELSSTQNGAITFTSSTGKEYSLEDPAWSHGAFTMALLEGLSGKASIPGKKKITVKSLDAYISERVKDLTNGKQHPTSVVPPNVPDFPIAAGN